MPIRIHSAKSLFVLIAATGGLACSLLFSAAPKPPKPEEKPAVPTAEDANINPHQRSPQDEIAAIHLQPGYHLELVASDPDIISPAVCAWDGNGRMYVAELRSYMLDIDGSKEKEPISRVSRWEDTKGDGHYDKHTVFVDHMMLPRMVLPLDDRILIRETDTKDIYAYRDTKGTGVADEKTLFYKGGGCGGNLEHQASGLLWNIDNWVYTTVEPTRYRFTGGKVETEKLAANLGQWGLAFDDTGRTFFNTAGGENPGFGFQVNPVYADIRLRDELSKGFVEVYPLLKMTDVQGGPGRLWPGGGLNHFTGCAGGSIYRGDALPADLYGDYILPEPVGRLIRRAKVTNEDGKIVLTNAYDKDEFIRSEDPNFRPVWTATGPDGCLYICDMYHGIIQESNWTNKGSYLRPHIQKYGLDKNINAGRIFRLVHDGAKRREKPHMLDEPTADLVKHLSDPNGWWRDTAQKLIVLRNDPSVEPLLTNLARKSDNPIARLHALWTLDGLGLVKPPLLAAKLKDADPRVRAAALRIAEPLLAKNDAAMIEVIKPMAGDSDPNVVIQYCMSLLHTDMPGAAVQIKLALDDHPRNEAIKDVVRSYQDHVDKARLEAGLGKQMMQKDPKLAQQWLKGRELYLQTCIACHGVDGKGAQIPGAPEGMTLAPSLRGSKKLLGEKEITCRIVLHGLVGPNDGGKVYLGQMAGFKTAADDWLAPIVTYARNDFGNHAPAITPEDLKHVREETKDRDKPYTLEELKTLIEAKPAEGGAKR
ncbi:MAG TPA: c-type cytochrome [Tepidisphaeraceae bacterium]|nr:c-type cytochrome [Tepidisphaeraceae bacterium]